MKKNCIYFNIVTGHSFQYYAMLYQAIESLFPFYDNTIDVIVYYDFEFDINTFKYNSKYSLLDFDFVKFIPSDYKKRYITKNTLPRTHDCYISKWYNLQNLFLSGYSNVFYTDCDVIFYKNPSYIFDKYDTTKNIFGFGCYDKVFDILYPKIEPFLSGQILINSNTLNNWSNFYNDIIEERIDQNKKAEDLFNQNKISIQEKESFQYFNEQYAPFMFLKKYKDFKHLSQDDYKVIDWRTLDGINEYFSVNIKNNNIILSSIKSTILHYCSSASSFMIKANLRTPAQQQDNNRWIDKIKNMKGISYE